MLLLIKVSVLGKTVENLLNNYIFEHVGSNMPLRRDTIYSIPHSPTRAVNRPILNGKTNPR